MIHVSGSVTIHCTPEQAFTFLAEGGNNTRWRHSVISASLKSGEAGKVGAIYAQQLKGPGGHAIAGDYELLEMVPNRRVVFQVVTGPGRPRGVFEFTPVADGVVVSLSLDMAVSGFMKLMEPVVRLTMQHEISNLEHLKTCLERIETTPSSS